MQDIKIWEDKMKEKRKNTPWKEFVKEICSWYGLLFNNKRGQFTNHAIEERMRIIDGTIYEEIRSEFTKYGVDYSDNLSLRDQISMLLKNVGVPGHNLIGTVENVKFSDGIRDAKNVYLSYISGESSSNILYSFHVKIHCNNVYNSVMVRDACDIIYQCSGIIKSFKIFYSRYIYSSNNMRFCSNMIGCSECIFCNDLTNMSYCINNIKLEKEEYCLKKEEILISKELFEKWYCEVNPKGKNIASDNCSGSYIIKSSNVSQGINVYQVKNGRNLVNVGGGELDENIFDGGIGGTPGTKDNYFCAILGGGNNYYGSRNSYYGSNIYYCIYCDNCSYCLACIGLKNKSFCILNKQYTKEERFELANKIFEKMDSDGDLGKFFPASMNPFYFNDTVAYLIDDSFTKEEVTKEGYLWRDEKIKVDIPPNAEIVETKNLSSYQSYVNDTRQINPEILKKVIVDEQGNYYTIQKMELEFLQKYGLPLPEIHWLDRIKLGFRFK